MSLAAAFVQLLNIQSPRLDLDQRAQVPKTCEISQTPLLGDIKLLPSERNSMRVSAYTPTGRNYVN
jgi:hypothetical protein